MARKVLLICGALSSLLYLAAVDVLAPIAYPGLYFVLGPEIGSAEPYSGFTSRARPSGFITTTVHPACRLLRSGGMGPSWADYVAYGVPCADQGLIARRFRKRDCSKYSSPISRGIAPH